MLNIPKIPKIPGVGNLGNIPIIPRIFSFCCRRIFGSSGDAAAAAIIGNVHVSSDTSSEGEGRDFIPPPAAAENDLITVDVSSSLPSSLIIHSIQYSVMKEKCGGSVTNNSIKDAIRNNKPIDNYLHVIAVISNPCNFKKRYALMRDFIKRMENEPNVILYIVELAYGKQSFNITSAKNPRHLQLRTEIPIWHKENMINLGVKYLLPSDWKAMAWIDADIDFDTPHWAIDALKILNGCKDVVQLFSHAVDMDASNCTMNVYNSFGFQYCKELPYTYKFPNYWHPGYCYAITRDAYTKLGGLFEYGILGASDHIMSFCIMNKGLMSINDRYSDDFKQKIFEYEIQARGLRLGYIPAVIRHYFHGSKVNRKYVERNEILLKHKYSPSVHLTRDASGILIPTADFCAEFRKEIYNYFLERNEDE